MSRARSLVVAFLALVLGASPLFAEKGVLRIPLPKRSKYTKVQQLNRDGVKAVDKHQFDKAKKLFYEAYLIDPNDPFTLNNLGYLAELEGDADRAQRFYQLASEQNSDAIVDKANNDLVEGKPVSQVAGNAEEKGIKINRLNSEAIALLNKGRAPEADLVLQKALKVDARNPFTLNNLGFAREQEGELDAAYQFYTAAANTGSRERVEIALDSDWRGREISDVARRNAEKLRKRLRNGDSFEARVAILNLRGVSAINRNDIRSARDFIKQAYKLAPTDAFTLNNMGYLAELDGDKETAEHFYERAQEANRSGARVSVATKKELEGREIGEVAVNSETLVDAKMAADQQARRQQGGPVLLRKRDNTPIIEPDKPAYTPPRVRVSDANGNLVLPPRPAQDVNPQNPSQGGGLLMPLDQQPTTVHEGQNDGGLMMPLPDNQQPGVKPANPNAPGAMGQPQNPPVNNPNIQQGPKDNGLLLPLPDNQQPGARPQDTQPPANDGSVKQGPNEGGLLLPLPDSQRPGAQPQPNAPQTQTPAPQVPAPQTQSAPPNTSSNVGVYTPPPAGGSNAAPSAPRKINDNDPSPKPTSPSNNSNTNSNGVKKISDR